MLPMAHGVAGLPQRSFWEVRQAGRLIFRLFVYFLRMKTRYFGLSFV
jgi:hypothetical protein